MPWTVRGVPIDFCDGRAANGLKAYLAFLIELQLGLAEGSLLSKIIQFCC